MAGAGARHRGPRPQAAAVTAPGAVAVTLLNADIGGVLASIRIDGGRIAAIGAAPAPGERTIDLHGDRVLPGLINAHDHLQLNSFQRVEYRSDYGNAREWIADVRTRRASDPALQAGLAAPRWSRLLTGAAKNLLSGVTTVAHHDPLYPELSHPDLPVRVAVEFGWSHSLQVDGPDRVQKSFQSTPAAWPWIIHAAEGTDEEARAELESLAALGCLGANTLIVHGVALDRTQLLRLASVGAGLIWCPASNLRIFGRTVDVAQLLAHGRVALGTDSRLSGESDLLAELRLARTLGVADDAALEELVTAAAARLLRLKDAGVLSAGARADLVVIPARMPLAAARRTDLRLVVRDGIARYGDEDYALQLAPVSDWVEVRVDGRRKALRRAVALLLAQAAIAEPGLELPAQSWRAA